MHLKFTKQKQIYRGEKKYLQAQTASSSLLQESAPQCCSKWLPKKLLTPATMLLQDSSLLLQNKLKNCSLTLKEDSHSNAQDCCERMRALG